MSVEPIIHSRGNKRRGRLYLENPCTSSLRLLYFLCSEGCWRRRTLGILVFVFVRLKIRGACGRVTA